VARTSSRISQTQNPKTSTSGQGGRVSRGFWRLLGASTDKVKAQSMAEVEASAAFDAKARDLDDEQLAKAARLLELEELATSADIPQFLAIARAAAERTTALRPFDVQLLGALRMMAGDVVEMATGEGKTLSGAIAAAGYALAGHRVHVVTINDYLARRDAEWMGPLITALGLTVGWITEESTREQRRAAYQCDVTYASVNEIGFDVLRDQLVVDAADLVSPNPDVALIDEADSVLVDEALVPLVLAGTTHRETPKVQIVRLVGELTPGLDYDTDADNRNVHLTETGAQKVERALGGIDLYSEEHVATTLTEVNVALHAHVLLQRDVHYIVRDGAVQLINASRGRIAALQRWPDGLQAAVEVKEGIETTETGEVLDTITVQALINRYPTVCGMTGTALAAGEQLRQFYKLGVSPIPPNTATVREDEPDRVYITAGAKNDAVVEHIIEVHATGQPILVGTQDVAESEDLHARLLRRGVPAVVLNAKNDEEEARVIAEAGKLGAVTVSTQMAGRGTDIRLGGSDADDDSDAKRAVAELGGLHVIGTERHESRRVDNQLRGRAGRQGDPGSTRFFLSLEDNLLRIFGGDRVAGLMNAFRVEEDMPIESGMLTRSLEGAQKKVETYYYDIRKQVFEYDEVMNNQRRAVYAERRRVLEGRDLKRQVLGYGERTMDDIVEAYVNPELPPEEWDLSRLTGKVKEFVNLLADLQPEQLQGLTMDELKAFLHEQLRIAYDLKEVAIEQMRPGLMREAERFFILQQIDTLWREHLQSMDALRESVGLRGYGQKDPLIEYKNEGYDMFLEMMTQVRRNVIYSMFMFEPQDPQA